MGIESHFASTLIGKILRKAVKEISFKTFISKDFKSLNENLEAVVHILFEDLKVWKNKLMLEVDEMLSTLIIGIFDSHTNQAELLVIGDGLICCNGDLYEYDQADRPDYLGYHLTENFEEWYPNLHQRLSLSTISDLSISTDGIFSFKRFDDKNYEVIPEEELIDYLLIDQQWADSGHMLKKKLIDIEKRYGLKSGDDLSIVRIIIP